MVSSIGNSCVHNYNYLNPSFRANNIGVSQSIASGQPTVNQPVSTNLIDRYLATSAYYNVPLINTANSKSTPSGVADYNNYVETDKFGKEVVSVKYSQNAGNITQNLKTFSPDGTTFEKTTTNGANKNSIDILIKDKQGRVILEKNKSIEKIDNDTSRTVVNGEVYNVTGLSTDVLTVEHNGDVKVIDLRKMTDENVEKMSVTRSADGMSEDETFENRAEKISDKEREVLYSKIKSMGGDDLLRMTKCTDELAFLDTPEGNLESFYNKRALIFSSDAPNFVVSHELGHGVNHAKSEDDLVADNAHFKNIREYEIRNYKKNKTSNDSRFDSKFVNSERLLERGYSSIADAEQLLRDETFAESYAVLNQTEIMDFDKNIGDRTLSLIKYLPRTLAQVGILS